MIILDKINHQSGDSNIHFVELLSRLQIKECTISDYNLLRSRVISEMQNLHTWNLSLNDYCPVIVSDNASKDAINIKMAMSFTSKSHQMLHWYTAEDTKNGTPIIDDSMLKIISLLHSGKTHG